MEVEFVSCFEATSQGVWLKSFIYGLRVMDSISRLLRIFCDNSTAVFFVISTLKLNGWPTNLVFSKLKEYPISLNCYKDIYP